MIITTGVFFNPNLLFWLSVSLICRPIGRSSYVSSLTKMRSGSLSIKSIAYQQDMGQTALNTTIIRSSRLTEEIGEKQTQLVNDSLTCAPMLVIAAGSMVSLLGEGSFSSLHRSMHQSFPKTPSMAGAACCCSGRRSRCEIVISNR